MEKESKVVTPAEGLREEEWELLSCSVHPRSTTLVSAAVKSLGHFFHNSFSWWCHKPDGQ